MLTYRESNFNPAVAAKSLSTRFCVCSLIEEETPEQITKPSLSTRFCVCSLIEQGTKDGQKVLKVSVQDFVYAHL